MDSTTLPISEQMNQTTCPRTCLAIRNDLIASACPTIPHYVQNVSCKTKKRFCNERLVQNRNVYLVTQPCERIDPIA